MTAKEMRENFHPHRTNLETKRKKSARYKSKADAITDFLDSTYSVMRDAALKIDFSLLKDDDFKYAAELFSNYYNELTKFTKDNRIDTRSGINSSFIEEMSSYLFLNNPIVDKYDMYFANSNICTGIRAGKDSLMFTKKKVDFCICNKIHMDVSFDKKISKYDILMPIICVECKTHMDGTMFRENIATSSKIHEFSPNAYNYVLMLWNEIGEETLKAERRSTNINEIFAFTDKKREDNINIKYTILKDYYITLNNALEEYVKVYNPPKEGKLLNI